MRQNGADMNKCKKVMTKTVLSAAVTAILLLVFSLSIEDEKNSKNDHSGIPDVVSSIIQNGDCALTVVANADAIEDKQQFAEKIIIMYRENNFSTTRFSTDIGSRPKNLYITVYLKKSDIKKGKEAFHFQYNADNCKISFCGNCTNN